MRLRLGFQLALEPLAHWESSLRRHPADLDQLNIHRRQVLRGGA
jgi:hypothetical protein